MYLRFCILFSGLLLLSYYSVEADILPAPSMQEVASYTEDFCREDLVVFDIDLVLVQPSDPVFQMANAKRYEAIARKIVSRLPADKRDIFWNLLNVQSDNTLIDAKAPALIADLQIRQVSTVALTKSLTGPLGSIPCLPVWKIAQLKRLGIDFTCGFPCRFFFYEFPSFRDYYSMYLEGIIFVNGPLCSKGDLLVAWIKRMRSCPRRVVFIDDLEENLLSVQTALKAFNPSIDYLGLHFTEAQDYPSLEVPEEEFKARWEAIAQLALTIP